MKNPDEIVKDVVALLTSIRKEKGLSHDKVAKAAGIHRSTLSLIESGKNQATLITCLKISKALQCSLGEIITKAEKKKTR